MADLPASSSASAIRNGARRTNKRSLAKNLANQLGKVTYADSTGKRVQKGRYMAQMLTELVTNGETVTTTGEVIKIRDFKDWLETVKFVHTHLDGPASVEGQSNTVNIFKVYAGIDLDKV